MPVVQHLAALSLPKNLSCKRLTSLPRPCIPTCSTTTPRRRQNSTKEQWEIRPSLVEEARTVIDSNGVDLHEQGCNQGQEEHVSMHGDWAASVPVNTAVYGLRPQDIPEEEWRVRVDLAAAYRQCYRQGLCEGIDNHLTALVPGRKDRFLVVPFGLHWSEVTASCLLVVNEDGKVLKGKGAPEATAFYIHAALHQKHPKGFAVMHTHQHYASSLCALEDSSIKMIHQNSARFFEDFVQDRYQGLVLDHNEGTHIANVMGHKRVYMHQNHGPIICAESVAACFDRLYFLEQACKVQCLAMATGSPLHIIDDKAAGSIKKGFMDSGVNDEYARLHLEALKRKMLRSEEDKDFLL